jgi:transcriptional regulator with XRE-family HTH domain
MSKKSPEAVDIQVGAFIRSQRLALGMSQTALADKLDITFQQVQKYEKGTNRVGSSRLVKIADALGVEPSFFFPRNGKSNAEDPEAITLASTIGATKLLRAYSEIRDTDARRAVVALVESLRGT